MPALRKMPSRSGSRALFALSFASVVGGAVACGTSSDAPSSDGGTAAPVGDGGAAYDNASACQDLVKTATCGTLGQLLQSECTTYAAEPCDLSVYFSCLASKYVCTNGQYDAALLATAGECSTKIPLACGLGGADPASDGGTGGASSAGVSLRVTGSRETGSNGYVVLPTGNVWLLVDVTLTNNTSVPLPLAESTFSVELATGIEYPARTYGADAGTPTVPACDPSTSISPGRSFECVEAFAVPSGAATTSVGYTLPGARDVTAPLDATLCVPCGPGTCVDVSSDSENCGACGKPVGPGTCVDGAPACDAGAAACGGRCVDLQSDPDNCGACGLDVALGGVCNGGVPGCRTGTTKCGETCADLQTDPGNCGACGRQVANHGVCDGGVATCAVGYTACGTDCIDIKGSDAANCGACGNVCPAQTTCSGGSCSGTLTSTLDQSCASICGSIGCLAVNVVTYGGNGTCGPFSMDENGSCARVPAATYDAFGCVVPLIQVSCDCGSE